MLFVHFETFADFDIEFDFVLQYYIEYLDRWMALYIHLVAIVHASIKQTILVWVILLLSDSNSHYTIIPSSNMLHADAIP